MEESADFPSSLLILRHDEHPGSQARSLSIPPLCELEELKNLAFLTAYPGNKEIPWDLQLENTNGSVLFDISLLSAFSDQGKSTKSSDPKTKKKMSMDASSSSPMFSLHKPSTITRSKSSDAALTERDVFAPETSPPPANKVKKSSSIWSLGRPKEPEVDESFSLVFSEGTRLYYKGYLKLKKEGKFMATVREAKSYWVILKGRELVLFKDHKKSGTAKKIDLGGSWIENIEGDPQANHFRLVIKASESYLVECENEEDKSSWMGYLEEAGSEHHDPDGVFGIHLETIQRVNLIGIPLVVVSCVASVEKFGLDMVGIYRLSASKSKIESLRKVLAAGHYEDIQTLEKWDLNTISCAFKQWLRELPVPLGTFDLYPEFTALGALPSVGGFKAALGRLPLQNRLVLQYILQHLKRVADNSNVNQMHAANLGAIFGPSLLRPNETQTFLVSQQNFAVEYMITHVAEIF